MDFSRLERAAIEAILSKPVDGMAVVREQFAAASALERDYTGVGFYTKISVPSSMPPMPDSEELHDALFHGAGTRAKSDPEGWVFFILWSDAGYLSCLEGYTVSDSWPNEDDVEGFRPCETRRDAGVRLSDDHLMPDCDNTFAVWRANTSVKTLLVTSLCALLVAMIVAFVAMILITRFM